MNPIPEEFKLKDPALELLRKSKKTDLILSENSPLGVRFHYLKGTSADIEKQNKIDKEKPGSPVLKSIW